MTLLRLASALPLVALLAACDDNPKPPVAELPAITAPAAAASPARAAATPASAAAAEPMFGSWSASLANCDTAAVTITATEFLGAENRCDITRLDDNGDGTFTAGLACTSQGQTASENIRMTPVFAPTGEGVVLEYLDRGGERVTLLRCR